MKMDDNDFPALFNSADKASIKAQKTYFFCLKTYIFSLIFAAIIAYYGGQGSAGAIIAVMIFLFSLGILVFLKIKKPEDIWYNGRAVAESVKTRTWRWMMRAEPYNKTIDDVQSQKEFLSDLKLILHQNRSLSASLEWTPDLGEAISDKMKIIRDLPLNDRLIIYLNDRVDNQRIWYSEKALYNKNQAMKWFIISVVVHSIAVFLLIIRINHSRLYLPIEIIVTIASGALSWVQANKYNELHSSYSLTVHEIVLIKSEDITVENEELFSDFIINSETAFSREHTQWIARKTI